MNPLLEELEALLFDWEEGTLDNAGVERVREILRGNDEAQAWYVRHQQLTTALRFQCENVAVSVPADPVAINDPGAHDEAVVAPSDERSSGRGKSRGWRSAAWLPFVAGLFVLLVARLSYLELRPAKPTVASEADVIEPTSHGVALVTRLVDVDWGDDVPLAEGDALQPGRFAIASGFAQVEFFCGATVILEGPAELHLQSQMQASVKRGRLRAQVPPAARGFCLEVDDMKVVDLGTEFGLTVSDGEANVQVFDGEIEVHSENISDGVQTLTAGDAVNKAADGAFSKALMTPDGFIDISDMESRSTDQRVGRFQRWQDSFNRLRADPRLITCYGFLEPGQWDRRLPNSQLPANTERDGAIVGATRVEGRWADKSALEFKRPGDRVRVQVDGDYESLTFCAWVRIDSLDRWFNSLFLTDNYNKGEPHWQILQSGQLYFSVRPVERNESQVRDFKAVSPPFWKPSFSGRWLHLATVYDTTNNVICHYLNGDLLSRHEVPDHQVVATRIGKASIGNWSLPTQPDAGFAIRNLNGRIDEFLLFADALTAGEIREIYNDGRPW